MNQNLVKALIATVFAFLLLALSVFCGYVAYVAPLKDEKAGLLGIACLMLFIGGASLVIEVLNKDWS